MRVAAAAHFEHSGHRCKRCKPVNRGNYLRARSRFSYSHGFGGNLVGAREASVIRAILAVNPPTERNLEFELRLPVLIGGDDVAGRIIDSLGFSLIVTAV